MTDTRERDEPAATVERRAPASEAQQQWWFLQQWNADETPKHLTLTIRMRDAVDVGAMRRVIDGVVDRHEALRTVLRLDDGRLHQVVTAPWTDVLTVRHLAAAGGPATDEVRRAGAAELRRGFDLQTGPLFAAWLDASAANEQVLCLAAHHAVADLRSLVLVAEEIAADYARLVRGCLPAPSPASQYADVAVAAAGRLSDERLDSTIAYWKANLAATTDGGLPTDAARPTTMSMRGDRASTRVDQSVVRRLRELAGPAGLTTVLLAAAGLVLGRHSGADTATLGLVHAGRHGLPGAAVGPFADLVPVRLDLARGASVADFVSYVRDAADAALAHGEVPFATLAARLGLSRDPSRHPVFQVGLDLLTDPGPRLRAGFADAGLTVDSVEVVDRDQRLDLWLRCVETVDGLTLHLDYATDLFDRRRIEHLAGHLAEALRRIAADPRQCPSQLPIIPADERERLLVAWRGPDCRTTTAMVHDLFTAQAARTPADLAVVEPRRRISYADLDLSSTRLANLLAARGVCPDAPVGVLLERGIDAVVAILGVLKAGGAYVPLDPTYPAERLRYVVEDSRAGAIVTRERLVPVLGDRLDVPLVLVDRDRTRIEQAGDTPPDAGVRPHNLVYLMYTSGSTGRPKGVRTRHANLSWYVSWILDTLPLDRFRNVFGSIAFSFDVSTMDIWPPLLTGGMLCLTEGLLAVPDDAPEFAGVTLMNLVPSVLSEYLRHNRLPDCLRTITVGGEHLSARLLRDIFRRSNVEDVHHLYGPTETTVFVTAKRLVRGRDEPITIGRPIAGTCVHILDRAGRLTPVGVPGEAYIGGPGVADGYLRRPELTAERFVPDLCRAGGDTGGMMYRTGDLCRWNFDGEIEFLGRLDDQVKIRGVRIELGEIEATLERHPDVTRSVVAVRENPLGNRELVAYVVPAHPSAPLDGLGAFCRDVLPNVMVPTLFVAIDAVPLSPTGKVDRHGLPDPVWAEGSGQHGFVPPATPTEKLLARIWSDVLDRPGIGAWDNFFQIGGHSLVAIRVVRQVETETGVKLPVRTLFGNPVLADVALVLAEALRERR